MMRHANYTTGVRSVRLDVVDNGRTFAVDGLRMKARLGGSGDLTTVDLSDAPADVSFADAFLGTTTGG